MSAPGIRVIWKLVPALLACCVAGAASAKLPAASDEAKAKAVVAKAKSDEAAKKDAEYLGKYQDRTAEHYRKDKGKAIKTSTTPAQKN